MWRCWSWPLVAASLRGIFLGFLVALARDSLVYSSEDLVSDELAFLDLWGHGGLIEMM